MSAVKKTTQVVSPPKNDGDMACESSDMAREEILHQASPDVRTQRAYVEEHGKWSPERVARYVKRKAKKTIDDVAMTPFLRKIAIFSSGGHSWTATCFRLPAWRLRKLLPCSTSPRRIGRHWRVGYVGHSGGHLVGGYLTDAIGRKKMFIIDLVAIALFSILSVFCSNPWELVAARFFIGVFVGADYPIATSLIAEFTPKKYRSISMGAVSAAWYLGATVAAFVGYFLYTVPDGWKWMLGSAVIPCIILLVGRHDIPESPMWLAKKGRKEEADEIVHRVFGEDVELEDEEEQPKTSLRMLLHSGYMKRMVFMGVFILCQVVPMYAIYTFGPDIMTAFGLGEGQESILGESVVSLFFLIGSIPAMFWLNSMGRRKLLLISLVFMGAGLTILGVWPMAPIFVVILAFGMYAFFSGGPGILQWLYPNELFPTEVRASAVGIAIGFSRMAPLCRRMARRCSWLRSALAPRCSWRRCLWAFAWLCRGSLLPKPRQVAWPRRARSRESIRFTRHVNSWTKFFRTRTCIAFGFLSLI